MWIEILKLVLLPDLHLVQLGFLLLSDLGDAEAGTRRDRIRDQARGHFVWCAQKVSVLVVQIYVRHKSIGDYLGVLLVF